MATDVEPKLPGMKPRVHPEDDERDGDHNCPQSDLEHVDVEVGPDGTGDGGQYQKEQDVTADAVILPQRLRVVNSTKHTRNSPHQKPEHVLHQEHHAGQDAQVAMHGMEMAVRALLDCKFVSE